MKMLELVKPQAVLPGIQATTRDEVIEAMVKALVESGAAPKNAAKELTDAILDREKNGSTGFGKGVAVPHVKHAKVKSMAAGIAVSPTGIDFNALDREPVYSVVMLLSPEDAPEQHLQAMETVFTNLQNDTFRKFLRQAETVEAVTDLLDEADSRKLAS